MTRHARHRGAPLLMCALACVVSCVSPADDAASEPTATTESALAASPELSNLVPKPASVTASSGTFQLTRQTGIYLASNSSQLRFIGQYLASKLRPSTGYPLEVRVIASGAPPGSIYLTTATPPTATSEQYTLSVTPQNVTLSAGNPEGLFRGVQTLRQLLPARIESSVAETGPWPINAAVIVDHPRFGWRGAMLDVARRFYTVAEVEHYIDLLAYYKINRFHLHLTDDQGWRIEIKSWPNLTTIGGSTQVGGGPGGFYTQEQYASIIAYARQRFIAVIPEIDMPGHVNAALASYGELTCSGVAPPLYTGDYSGGYLPNDSLCASGASTGRFITNVITEIAALTPGWYIHIGGDEASSTVLSDYKRMIAQAQAAIAAAGKRMIGWEEIAKGTLPPTAVAQHWEKDKPVAGPLPKIAVAEGVRLLMSPSSRAYLSLKYDPTTPVGGIWAGYLDEEKAYSWDPLTVMSGVSGLADKNIIGVESPLWTLNGIDTMAEVEQMAFPRVIGHAEIGWSPASGRSWTEYQTRVGSHGPRLRAMGVNYYPSGLIPWQ